MSDLQPGGAAQAAPVIVRTDVTEATPITSTKHRPVRIFFGRTAVDDMTDGLGTPLHKVSPLLGNAYNNGSTLRTLLGNAYFLLVIASGLLGGWAVHDTKGLAIPPVLWLTIALMVIGIFDAFSGLVAWFVFTLGVVFSGHFFSRYLITGPPGTQSMLYAFTGLLTMGFIWFIGPQLPRRLRILGFGSIKDRLQRRYIMVGDFFVITLLMILILGSAGIFVPIFTGAYAQSLTQVNIQEHLTIIKICVGIAAFLRVGLDEIAYANFQPLAKSVGRHRGPIGEWIGRLIGAFIALVLIWELLGTIWQWPVTWILLISLEALTALGERFLKPSSVYRFVPRNLFRIVVLLLFIEYAAMVLAGKVVTGSAFLGWLVLLFAILVAIFAILDGPEDEEVGNKPATWITRILGMIVVTLLFILSQGLWSVAATPYSNPSAVAVSSNGTLFIADSGNNRVIEVPINGTRMTVGSGLSNPSGVAPVPGSTSSVYIADTNNNRVLRVSLLPNEALGPIQGSGHYALAAAATTQVSIGSGFSHPTGLASNAAGDLFVTDTGHNRIVEVNAHGGEFTVVSGLSGPLAVAADPFGHLYVANSSSGTVIRYSLNSSGHATSSQVIAKDLSRPAGVAADAQGNVYVSNTGANKVIKFSANATQTNVKGEFHQPRGLAVDGQGHLYIANAGAGTIILSEPAYTGSPMKFGPAHVATAAAIASDGTYYTVSASARTLEHVTSTGSTIVASNLDDPVGVAWSALGRLYVAQYTNGSIIQVNPTTGKETLLAYGLNGITSITPDPYGGLFAVEASGNLVAIDAQGRTKILVSGLHSPTGVTQDAYDHVVVTLAGASTTKGQLWRITFGAPAEVLVSGLNDPAQPAADSYGDTFFIERGTDRVWEDRGLLGAQIVWQGHGRATDPSALASDLNGNVVIFPQVPGATILVTLSTTDYEV